MRDFHLSFRVILFLKSTQMNVGCVWMTSEVGENDDKRRNEEGSGHQGEGSENNNEVMRNGMEMIGYVRGVCRSE